MSGDRRLRRWPLLGLFLAALVVRGAFVVLEPPAQRVGDEGMWKAMGRELASPEVGFSPLRSRLVSHPPLYPYMIGGLLALFHDPAAIKWAQALLGALLVPAVFLLGNAGYGRRVGLLAAAFAAFDPVLVWQSTHLWAEVLFLALLWWAFERLARADAVGSSGAAAVAGLCWGLAILARETVFYFAPLVALWLAWPRRAGTAALDTVGSGPSVGKPVGLSGGLRRAAVFLLTCALVVAPWAWRNKQLFGFALPLATRGTLNLWKGNTALPWADVHARYWLFGSEQEKHRRAGEEAWREIRAQQPWWVFKKTIREIPALWGVNNLVIIHLQNGAYGRLPTAANWIVSAVTIVPYVALLALAVWGLAATRAERVPILLVGFLLVYTALHVVVFGFPRFRLPVMPVVFLLAADGWRRLREGPPLGAWRRLVAGALALVLGATVVQSLVETLQHPIFGLVR
jgi:hypothetical protein